MARQAATALETAPAVDASVVTFVFPCLNEEDGVGPCVEAAKTFIAQAGYTPDIVVVDNGCTDRSVERAEAAGARVIREDRKGYGRAIRTGIDHANGEIVFMADADGTYDLAKIPEFIRLLREEGADMVIGNRYHEIEPGAMPLLHRYLGTPVLGLLMKLLFRTGVKDVNCGMRAFTQAAYRHMNLVTTGMEFASEMVIRAINLNLHFREVNFKYHVRIGDSKLNTVRDGLRHLRLILLYSPDFVYLAPALLFWVVGAAIVVVLFPRPLYIGERAINLHTMLVGAILNLTGLYLGALGIVAKAYGHFAGLRDDRLIAHWSGRLRLKHGLYFGAFSGLIGLLFVLAVLVSWFRRDFGNIQFVRELILGLVSMSNGMVIAATSFVLSLMVIPHSDEKSPYLHQGK